MRNTLLLIAFTVSLIFTGCGGSDAKKVEMEVLLYNKMSENNTEKYPKTLQEISQPFIEVGDKKLNFAFAPLSFKRVDLNKKFELEYLNNKAGDASKIKFVNRQIDNYFRDSLVPDLLVSPSTSPVNVADELNRAKGKPNYFIYSSEEDLEIDGKEIYHSVSDLRSAITKFLYGNENSKIVVLYEPPMEKKPSPRQTPMPNPVSTPPLTAENSPDDDPFALYSLSKTVTIAGEKHHEAFELLNKAAILAVEQGKAPELLRRIMSDLDSNDPNDNVVRRLATHKDDWIPLIDALNRNDASKLHDEHNKEKSH